MFMKTAFLVQIGCSWHRKHGIVDFIAIFTPISGDFTVSIPHIYDIDTIDARLPRLTQKTSQVRVPFPSLLQNELLDMSVEQFLASLHFEKRGKLDQLGVEMGSFD